MISATLTLRQRIFRAGTWTISGAFVSQVMRLGSNLIMTRLLIPEMFGVMALANVLMTGMQMLSDLGLKQNIVQSRRGNDPVFLNTVWSVQILRAALLWLLMLGGVGGIYLVNAFHWWPLHSVYAEPVLPLVIAVLSFNVLIIGFESTKLATASRNLALGRMVLIDLTCGFAGVVIMVSWALIDRSIWALVFGTLFTSVLRVLAGHQLLPGVGNRLHWDKESFHEIFHFGKWVFVSSILGFLASNGDRLLLGGLIDPVTLGIYSIAFMMVNALRDVFMQLSSSVAFPAFSEVVRDRREALKRTYYKFRLPLDVATLLAMGLLMSAGHLLIQLLYDNRYAGAGHMIEILCISLFEVRFTLAGQSFMAMGMPKLLTPIILIRLAALFGIMPLAFHTWGLDGALWVVGGSALLTLPLIVLLKMKHGLFDPRHELALLPLVAVGYALGYLIVKSLA